MKKHCRRLTGFVTYSIGVVAMFFACSTQAVTLGHSRVVSSPDQPLRIMVQLKDVTASDLSSLTAEMAPLSAWQEAGLKPPVDLSSLNTQLKPSAQTNSLQLWVQSSQKASAQVLDVLVDVKTASATQRHQVSVLQRKKASPIGLASTTSSVPQTQTAIPTVSRKKTVELKKQITVKKGQYLYQIARKLRSDQYNDQQLMAALVQANPTAFIQNNMNLLRSGVTLEVPNAELISAITPQQARQIYEKHLQHFDEYRQRIAKGQPPAALPLKTEQTSLSSTAATKEVAIEKTKESTQDSSLQTESDLKTDRLELSAQTDAVAKADQATSTQQELAYTAERLAELESTLTKPTSASTEAEKNNVNTTAATAVDNNLDNALNTQTLATTNGTEQLENNRKNTQTSAMAMSWLESNILFVALGLLLLMVILVGWFLRSGYPGQKADVKVDQVKNKGSIK